jgi:thiamine-phosphate pyrophosphorylase
MGKAIAAPHAHLKRLRRRARGLAVYQLTDPDRMPPAVLANDDPLPVTATIVRHYGQVAEITDGLALHGPVYLSAPVPTALTMPGHFGLYWPSVHVRQHRVSHRLRRAPMMASAHTGREIARALKHGVGRIVISPVFASDSPSAGRALTPVRLAMLKRWFPKAELIALGGVHAGNVGQLRRAGIVGVAGVSWSRPKT